MRGVINCFSESLCERSAKRDAFTADIYYHITNEFGYAKRGLCPAAYAENQKAITHLKG